MTRSIQPVRNMPFAGPPSGALTDHGYEIMAGLASRVVALETLTATQAAALTALEARVAALESP